MALDYNLLSLLTGQLPQRVGIDGRPMQPGFSGGQGMDQNLLALLVAGGQLPRHQDMNGDYILPGGDGRPQFKGLDAYQALQQGVGSRLLQPQTQPSASMLPNAFSNKPQVPLLPNPAFQRPGPPLLGRKPYTV